MTKYSATVTAEVVVIINDPNVIDRCVNNEDGWRDNLYPLDTPEKVVAHLAYNCAINNVTDINRLDGWADLDPSAVTMYVADTEADEYDVEEL